MESQIHSLLSFHVHLLTFTVRSKLLIEENKDSIGKKKSIDGILESVHNAGKRFEASVDTCRDQYIEATHAKTNEVLHDVKRTSDHIWDMNYQVSKGFDDVNQRLELLLQSREEATDGLRILLSEKLKGKYIYL